MPFDITKTERLGYRLRKWAKILFSAEEMEAAFVGHPDLSINLSGNYAVNGEGEEQQIFTDKSEPQATQPETHPI